MIVLGSEQDSPIRCSAHQMVGNHDVHFVSHVWKMSLGLRNVAYDMITLMQTEFLSVTLSDSFLYS